MLTSTFSDDSIFQSKKTFKESTKQIKQNIFGFFSNSYQTIFKYSKEGANLTNLQDRQQAFSQPSPSGSANTSQTDLTLIGSPIPRNSLDLISESKWFTSRLEKVEHNIQSPTESQWLSSSNTNNNTTSNRPCPSYQQQYSIECYKMNNYYYQNNNYTKTRSQRSASCSTTCTDFLESLKIDQENQIDNHHNNNIQIDHKLETARLKARQTHNVYMALCNNTSVLEDDLLLGSFQNWNQGSN